MGSSLACLCWEGPFLWRFVCGIWVYEKWHELHKDCRHARLASSCPSVVVFFSKDKAKAIRVKEEGGGKISGRARAFYFAFFGCDIFLIGKNSCTKYHLRALHGVSLSFAGANAFNARRWPTLIVPQDGYAFPFLPLLVALVVSEGFVGRRTR